MNKASRFPCAQLRNINLLIAGENKIPFEKHLFNLTEKCFFKCVTHRHLVCYNKIQVVHIWDAEIGPALPSCQNINAFTDPPECSSNIQEVGKIRSEE